MAYHFDGVDDRVRFNIAPFTGYLFGPVTVAIFCRITNTDVSNRPFVGIMDSSDSGGRVWCRAGSSGLLRFTVDGDGRSSTSIAVAQNVWTIVAYTWTGAGAAPRMHRHNGTGWVHTTAEEGTIGVSEIVAASDLHSIGVVAGSYLFDGDIVCVGIKKAVMNDAAIEGLSRTEWASWLAAGFNWLVGLETSGALQDQGTAGTGDETSRVGTTLVSDPAGWSWATAPPSLVSIAVTPADTTIDTDDTQQYLATGTYSDSSTADITDEVTWSSSNPAAATIDSAGLATAVGVGDTTIAADE